MLFSVFDGFWLDPDSTDPGPQHCGHAQLHMMHKIMHGGGGLDHQTWFTKGSDSGRATRSTADPLNVTVKNGRLDIRSKFLSVRAPAQWNAVPSDIKQLQPAQRFKTAYKQFRENPV